MRRREVVAVFTAVMMGARPGAVRAQRNGLKRVGVVHQGGPYEPSINALRDGLRAAGLEEGRHIALLLRNLNGDVAAAEAAALVLERDEKVEVIVAIGTTTARAAKRATMEVPIVFAGGTDPVAAGLVESIARPGGRLTGFHFLTVDLTAKRLEILREIVPKLRRIVTFYDLRTPSAVTSVAAAREAAGKLDIEVVAQQVTSPEELRDRLRTLTAAEAEAFFFITDFLVTVQAPLVIEAANALRLPTMATNISLVRMGALAGYGPDFREYGRGSARYVARILGGSLPHDLPVEAINRPALAINLKTATALGRTIPPDILLRADEVIE
jgi:putative tryptophan/tyrosine transport system substrate-binding protein